MMGGRTLVLVGKTGNGKSATGNSILGNKMFHSQRSFSGVTRTCELKTRVLEDGQMLNVIDTPGFFDSSVDNEIIEKEIVNCINMAIDGIHAVLVVYSVCSRFSDDEKAVVSNLKGLFGEKICDYMIVVFTGGDDLEAGGRTLEDFLCDCPDALKEVLCLCGIRFVVIDNRTKDETKKANQVQQLLSLVNKVVEKNGGEPYTNEIFTEMKKLTSELEEQTEAFRVLKQKGYAELQIFEVMEKLHAERWNEIFKMVMVMKLNFERELLKERIARMNLEDEAITARRKAKEDIDSLKEELKRRGEEKQKNSSCVIL